MIFTFGFSARAVTVMYKLSPSLSITMQIPRARAISRGLQDVVPFRISLNGHDFIFQELTLEPLVGFDEDKGNLQLVQLIHHCATDLAISANNEVAFHCFEADFVHHGFSKPPFHAG
jgi:hypothetical protein